MLKLTGIWNVVSFKEKWQNSGVEENTASLVEVDGISRAYVSFSKDLHII